MNPLKAQHNNRNFLFAMIVVLFVVAFKGTAYNPPAAQNVTSRAFTTGFRPNTQRDCIVGYTINITSSATLASGSVGTVTLQWSTDSTTWQSMMTASSGLVAGLINPGSVGSVTVFGLVKAGMWCRIVPTSTGIAPTFSVPAGTELSF